MPRQQWTALSFTTIKTGIIIFSFYILLFYVQGVKHKLFFSRADTTAKNSKNMKFAYQDAATSILYKDKLPRVATRTLCLLDKY